ncbi:Two-component sensor histidine kinase, contains HisKA and HATPase domains [Loktanella fryxellensis]|uniref:histidine kinase n=1 Tax=Loktanella fryxellensis TaxID=245187 RepID=A0A1H8KE53_9RHOB|nr:sensor histidine kinase [Loktanella fryxellensis]SEN91279.1 Two-component sensor histidine kinase, contains HisKA and HATPase domains [Loktanella fryxellensis]
MATEVEHRAKNTLALISGLLRMTKADSAAQLDQIMQGRIRVLIGTMGLLREAKWSGADLRSILSDALSPFTGQEDEGTVVTLSGPAIWIDVSAAQSVSMAFHELATNAGKYGALSTSLGKLDISWDIADGRVEVKWRESGGPPVVEPPTRVGFGLQLVSILFEGQLGGIVTRDWSAEGLVCRLSFP